MASWITHLRIAELIQEQMQYPSYEYFLIGNVAPDSGILNEDRISYTPDYKTSHFRSGEKGKWKIEDLNYYNKYIKNCDENIIEGRCFHYGYFIHLISDTLWTFFIAQPVKNKYIAQYEQDPLFMWEVRKDMHGLDVEYLMNNQNWGTWDTFKKADYRLDCLDFYPPSNIQQKLVQIKNNFQADEEFIRSDKYIKKRDGDLFIRIASILILDILNHMSDISTKYEKTVLEYLADKYDLFKGTSGNLNELVLK